MRVCFRKHPEELERVKVIAFAVVAAVAFLLFLAYNLREGRG